MLRVLFLRFFFSFFCFFYVFWHRLSHDAAYPHSRKADTWNAIAKGQGKLVFFRIAGVILLVGVLRDTGRS